MNSTKAVRLLVWLMVAIPCLVFGQSQGASHIDQQLLNTFLGMEEVAVESHLNELDPALSAEYATTLAHLWQERRNPGMVRTYLHYAMRRAEEASDKKLQGEISFFKCQLSRLANNPSAALSEIQTAARLFAEGGLTNEQIQALLLKAQLEHVYGYLSQSLRSYEQLNNMAVDRKDLELQANCQYEMALIEEKVGRGGRSKERIEEALKYYEQNKNVVGAANCLKVMGTIASREGDEMLSLEYYEKARKRYEEANEPAGRADCLFNIGLHYQTEKKFNAALQHLHEALATYIMAGSLGGAGIAHMEIGRTFFMARQYPEAEHALLLARYFLEYRQSLQRLAQTYSYLGDLREAQGRKKEAADMYREAIRLYRDVGLDSEAQLNSLNLLRVEPIKGGKR